jgi:hypothetical protein
MFLRAGPTAPESTAVSNDIEAHLKHTFAVPSCAEKSVCYNFVRAVDKRVEGLDPLLAKCCKSLVFVR